MMKPVILIFLIWTSFVRASELKKLNITTARGDEIEAQLISPQNIKGKLPAVIIAPGQGYHMDLPIIKQLAEKTTQENIVSLRFNWHYFSHGEKPSEDLSKEVQDMTAALNYLQTLSFVDNQKIMVAGKSLGTLVAYKIFQNNPDLFSLYLLTPLCTWHWDEQGTQVNPFAVGELRYPKLNSESRGVHLTLGNKDLLCFPSMLYDFLRSSKGNISISVFGGDHGMNIGPWNDPTYEKRNADNIKTAVDTTVHWMNLHLNE